MNVCSVKSGDHLLILESKERTQELAERIQKEIDNGGCEIDIVKKKRSLNANAYMWYLCSEIGKEMNKSKEDIYRKMIRDIGVSEDMTIKETALDDYINRWQHNGLGWIVEKIGDSIIRGCVDIKAYYGSSSYNTKEMSDAISYLVADAEELGVKTLKQQELDSLIQEWGIK